MIPLPFRVDSVKAELSDVFTMTLSPADGGPYHAFAAGQFNMLYVFGAGEVPISISGPGEGGGSLVHTVRAVGDVTNVMAGLKPGDVLGVRGPFGSAWPMLEAEGADIVIVVGGLGIAPLRPAIYHVLAHRARYGDVCIYYGARSPEDILFADELKEWRGHFDLTVDIIVDRADDHWTGKVGVVTRLIDGRDFDAAETVALVCGPEVMMRYAVKTLKEHGVEEERIYVSMERNMKCAIGLCGHCQYGPHFICKDGPVFPFDRIARQFEVWEL